MSFDSVGSFQAIALIIKSLELTIQWIVVVTDKKLLVKRHTHLAHIHAKLRAHKDHQYLYI